MERCPADELEQDIDRQIVEGCERVPQTEAEDRWADAAAREAIAEERW